MGLETEKQVKSFSSYSHGVVLGRLLKRDVMRPFFSGFKFYVEMRIFCKIDSLLFDFLKNFC